ncbi:probable myosin light chain kinase DDB_G0279831 [Physella acuta]|uniref:probable myosin light chain kinase DDB_G0279831 n=1 Tax=Physella acuta TaxID=109671 RepID=UPI0027DBD1DB|nr:probable myosin light chain kinase DDB_G0279831 [Physella acuta]
MVMSMFLLNRFTFCFYIEYLFVILFVIYSAEFVCESEATYPKKVRDSHRKPKSDIDETMRKISKQMGKISLHCQCYFQSCTDGDLSCADRKHVSAYHSDVTSTTRVTRSARVTPRSAKVTRSVRRVYRSNSSPRTRSSSFSSTSSGSTASALKKRKKKKMATDDARHIHFDLISSNLESSMKNTEAALESFKSQNSVKSSGSSTSEKSEPSRKFLDEKDMQILYSKKPSKKKKTPYPPLLSLSSTTWSDSSSVPSQRKQKEKVAPPEPVNQSQNAVNSKVSLQDLRDQNGRGSSPSHSFSFRNSFINKSLAVNNNQNSESRKDPSSPDCNKNKNHRHRKLSASKRKENTVHRKKSVPGRLHRKPAKPCLQSTDSKDHPTKHDKVGPNLCSHCCVQGKAMTKPSSSAQCGEQGIRIITKPGQYIVRKPVQGTNTHVLHVEPGRFVNLTIHDLVEC